LAHDSKLLGLTPAGAAARTVRDKIGKKEKSDESLLKEEDPLLCPEDDLNDFTAGMAVTTSNGNRTVKVNCCDALLKQCLELIDAEASAVLASEDIEDLDIKSINMIVCRSKSRQTFFSSSPMMRRNKLECLNLTNIFKLIKYANMIPPDNSFQVSLIFAVRPEA
jgi:hypothetical protein